MKNAVALALILICLLFIAGCSSRVNGRTFEKQIDFGTLAYHEHLRKGKTNEHEKKLQQAIDQYKQALITAPNKSYQQKIARKSILRVQRKIDLAKKYCQDYQKFIEKLKASEAQKALEKVHNIWPDYRCEKIIPTQAEFALRDNPIEPKKDKKADKPVDYKILSEEPISYKLRKGDTLSKLCQQHYETTAHYKIVQIVLDYNKMDHPSSMVVGQTIFFPTIQIGERKYKPNSVGKIATDNDIRSTQNINGNVKYSMPARGLGGIYKTENRKIDSPNIPSNEPEIEIESKSIDDTKQPIKAAMELPKANKLSNTITRHPTFESPEEVNINKEFAVQITLTEELITPDVIIKTPPGDQTLARVTFDGKLEMKFAGTPQQKEWRIDIVLAASGFKLPKGNTASVILPQTGDSTPAVFYLKAKPIQTARRITRIYATLWHRGTYLAKLIREITVINPTYKPSNNPTGVVGQSLLDTHTKPALMRSSDDDGSNHAKQIVKMNVGFKAPDLTLFILENPIQGRADETQIIINSPHLQPIAQTYPTPKGLDQWLEHQYQRFAQQGSRAKIIPLNPNSPSDKKPGEMASHIKGFGRELYRKYAPAAFKRAFWKLVDQLGADFDSIQILSINPLLPWEMMRPMRDDGSDERDFMGLEFKIGRWHINPGAFQQERPSQAMAFRKIMVIAPQYQKDGELPQQDMELQALQKIRGYESIGGNLLGLLGLFQKLPQGIIHFAGHGLVKSSASGVRDYVICLEDAELDVMAWKGMIQVQNDAHPFFFFNACYVGQSRQMANFVDGWAPAVLESGASGYIGALWPLGDRGAADFAIRFYQALDRRLQNGAVDIAELLRVTRRRFLQNGDPTFLAYVFYGDPYLRIQREFDITIE